jgi:hypothetical protein
MVVVDSLFAIVLAFLLALVLSVGLTRRGPGPLAGFLFFFVLLWLAIWAGGVWLMPIGPPVWGAPFITFLIVGFFMLLIIAALTSPAQTKRTTTPEERQNAAVVATALSVFFWLLLGVLLVSIVLRYVRVA